eukprot:2625570-Prymnesium_polylepis.1
MEPDDRIQLLRYFVSDRREAGGADLQPPPTVAPAPADGPPTVSEGDKPPVRTPATEAVPAGDQAPAPAPRPP